MYRSLGPRKVLLFFMMFLLLVNPASGAERLTLLKDGVALGGLDAKTHQGGRFVPVGRMAGLLGYRVEKTGDSVVVRGSKTSLKFVPGATAAIIQGQIIALSYNMLEEKNGWWIEKDDALKAFGSLASVDSGRQAELSWEEDKASQKTAKIQEAAPMQKEMPVAVKPPASAPYAGGQVPTVTSLRWGYQDFGIRAVIDYNGSPSIEISPETGRVDVTIQGVALPGAVSPSPSPEEVEVSVSQFGDRVCFSFTHRARKVEHFALESPRRYVVDFHNPEPLKEKIPSVVETLAVEPPKVEEDEKAEGASPLPLPPKSPHDDGKIVVVIDPGHGGKDPGAVANGAREKDINLQVAKYLADSLRQKGVEPVLTRSGDNYLKLSDRTDIAMRRNADLFVSLHCNALPAGRHARGVEIYLMALPTDKDAMELARIENREITNGGVESDKAADKRTEMLLKILGDMQQNVKIQESTDFAEALFSAGKRAGLDMRRVAQAPFYVLRGAAMPSVLIEMGFLTEKSEASLLKNAAYQKKLAAFISAGIMEYLGK
jgi:N-acetylmuramoyl-L-alanine amidase